MVVRESYNTRQRKCQNNLKSSDKFISTVNSKNIILSDHSYYILGSFEMSFEVANSL